MITTASWVPRGFAAPFPKKYTFDEAEFERIAELAKLQLDDANEDYEEAQEEQEGGAKLQGEGGASAKKAAKEDAMDEDEETYAVTIKIETELPLTGIAELMLMTKT